MSAYHTNEGTNKKGEKKRKKVYRKKYLRHNLALVNCFDETTTDISVLREKNES